MWRDIFGQPLVMASQNARSLIRSAIKQDLKMPRAEELTTAAAIAQADMVKRIDSGEIAVIPVRGIIEHRLSVWGYWFGGCSCESLSMVFQACIDDSTIKRIVLDFDTPGGTYPGIPEFAAQVFAQRDAKGNGGVVGVVDPQCSSGGYWIGSACQKLYTIGSGAAGSIGCYNVHTEMSKFFEEEGITNTVLRDPEYKCEWNPWEPLSDEARAFEQQRVSDITAEFQAAVAKHRGVSKSVVASTFGQGRELPAKDCADAGMVDGIRTLAQVIGRVRSGGNGRKTEEQQADPKVAEGDTIASDTITNPRLKRKLAGAGK